MAARFPFLTLGLAVLACFASVSESHEDAKDELGFSYLGSSGPQKWGSLNPQYALCAKGKTQSPINIVSDEVVKNSKLKPLVRNYHSTNATLINNGFNIGMKFNPDVGTLSVDEKDYSLLQMHWHTPSEHQIDGEQYVVFSIFSFSGPIEFGPGPIRAQLTFHFLILKATLLLIKKICTQFFRFPAELHLVHMGPDHGSLAVVSILFKYGGSDPILNKLKDELEELGKEKCQKDEEARISVDKVNIKYLRKTNKKFYRYVGSLTTPPCSENVMWNILTKVRTISKEQVELLEAPLDSADKKNCRPVQSLNGRKVELYKKSDDDDDEDD